MTLDGVTIDLQAHPDVIAVCLGLLVGYWALVRRYGPVLFPRPDERSVSRTQIAAFVGGVAALYLAAGAPLHDLADQALFSAHMVEHLLYALVVPPLLLIGVPGWMLEALLRDDRVRRAVVQASRPVVAGLAFNLVLLGVHWPAVIDLMLASELFHLVAHTVLLLVALAMWMNVLSPDGDLVPRLSPVGQLLYLFLMTLLPTVPASFLTFAERPLYPVYATFEMPWGLDAVADLRIAGLIMKVGGGMFLWGVIAVLYFRWAAEEERDARPSVEAGARRDTPARPSEPGPGA